MLKSELELEQGELELELELELEQGELEQGELEAVQAKDQLLGDLEHLLPIPLAQEMEHGMILVKHEETSENHHNKVMMQCVMGHMKVGEMEVEMEHVNAGEMEFEKEH